MNAKHSLLGIVAGLSVLCVSNASVLANGQDQLAQNVEPVAPTLDENGLFNIDAGRRLLNEGSSAVSGQNYGLATEKFKDSRQLMNQLSNFYQGLAKTFTGVDPVVSRSLRSKALETAELRDQSTYQLALVYRAQNQSDKAIPLLIEIVRSQNPSRDLGKKAYRQLLELGFVDTPYPRSQTTGQVR
ncbi:MAG: hypothetical protein AAGB01_06400 [Cyanobacteria bacterium P01_F01_bin.42]